MEVTTEQLLAEIGRLHVQHQIQLGRIAKLTKDNADVARELSKARGGAKKVEPDVLSDSNEDDEGFERVSDPHATTRRRLPDFDPSVERTFDPNEATTNETHENNGSQ